MIETDLLVYGFPLVLMIMGVCQIAKKFVAHRWIPLIAIGTGVLLVSLTVWQYWTPESVIKGLVAGLVSSGLWSSTKSLRGK